DVEGRCSPAYDRSHKAARNVLRRAPMKSFVLAISFLASAVHAQGVLPRPDHIVIVIEENKSFSDVIGSKHAPYLNALARRGAVLTNFTAAHHPSQPNYVDFFAG